MRNTFIHTVIEACASRDDIIILSGDAGLGVFDTFREKFPDRFFNMGVAEQNATGYAAGLALAGCKVFLYNIAPFVLFRPYEQVRNDICYQELPVVLVGTGCGITYAPQGQTHYAVEDLGVARTLPNLQVISPSDPVEAAAAARYALEADAPLYVRLAKTGEPELRDDGCPDITTPAVMKEGDDAAMVFHGPVGGEVLAAAEKLELEGIKTRIVSVPMVQPVNGAAIKGLLSGIPDALVVEDQYKSCGLWAVLQQDEGLKDSGTALHYAGLPDRFIHDVNDTAAMRVRAGYDAEGLAAAVSALVKD